MLKIIVTFSLVIAAALTISSDALLEAQESPDNPNILFIYLDDAREDDLQFMPKTEELLADQGISFDNAYATFPLCCPARTTTLTGLYTHNHGVKTIKKGEKKFREHGNEERTIALALDPTYRTGLFGKYLNGYTNGSHVPPGWDEWATKIDGDGGGEYYGYRLSLDGITTAYGNNTQDYQTDVIADFADAFLREDSGEPFFAYVAPSAPHGPLTPAKRHKGALGGNQRGETLLSVDEMVARFVATLQETGKLENTYIFFSSDNGWMSGEHGMNGGKRTFYEESAGVPLLIRGPGVPASLEIEELTANHDFAPTFAEIGGVALPDVDGRSLAPIFNGGSQGWRKNLLLHNPTNERGPYRAVVTDRYKLVDRNGGYKLFDLDTDPKEQNNLIESADSALVDDLRSKLAALQDCAGKSCQEAEDIP